MRRGFLSAAWLSVGATLIGFVLPWAKIDVREPALMKQLRATVPLHDRVGELARGVSRVAVKIRRGAETITGDLPTLSDIPRQVSGVQIPQMANQEHAQVAMAVVELLTNTRQHLGAKSYAVYLLPGLALLCAMLLTGLRNRVPVAVGIALVCAAIAGAGFRKLLTTNTTTLFVAVTIGEGLWLSLWGYVGLAASAAGLALSRR